GTTLLDGIDEAAEEITGSARAMRAKATRIPTRHDLVVDTAGTGGDGAHGGNRRRHRDTEKSTKEHFNLNISLQYKLFLDEEDNYNIIRRSFTGSSFHRSKETDG
ncbi:MAG: hypothetical protein ACE5FF_13635, partial [Saprospiraceae bacterium]